MAATLATCDEGVPADARPLDRLRPHTLRTYRYALAMAARSTRCPSPTWRSGIARTPAAPSTVGRRWAVRHGHCARLPLLDDLPARRHRVSWPRRLSGRAPRA